MNKNRSANDQRSDVKNPNDRDHKADQDHRSRQLNPQDELYGGNDNSKDQEK